MELRLQYFPHSVSPEWPERQMGQSGISTFSHGDSRKWSVYGEFSSLKAKYIPTPRRAGVLIWLTFCSILLLHLSRTWLFPKWTKDKKNYSKLSIHLNTVFKEQCCPHFISIWRKKNDIYRIFILIFPFLPDSFEQWRRQTTVCRRWGNNVNITLIIYIYFIWQHLWFNCFITDHHNGVIWAFI